MADTRLYIGIDLGTSGCRAIAIDDHWAVAGEARVEMPAPMRRGPEVEQEPEQWWQAIEEVLSELLRLVPAGAVRSLAVDGTSGTVLVVDKRGRACGPALMYNDNRAVAEARRIAAVAPVRSAAHGTGSGLAKLLWLLAHDRGCAALAVTQADWAAARLCGRWGLSDENNVLKLGWDALRRRWPGWLARLGVERALLPDVLAPGQPMGRLRPELAEQFGLPGDVAVIAGTTDSTAAILATGAAAVGDGITSLGSTLVTKVIAVEPVFAPEYGVYSQPLGERWLVGGGSNSGGAVLQHFFSAAQIAELSARIDPARLTGLDYYPLLAPGERFPVADPNHPPRLEPRPDDDALFFQGMLEGMAAIEAAAYRKLEALGAPYPRRIFSVGGGAANRKWEALRAAATGCPMADPRHHEAAFGSALLARKGASGARAAP